MSVDGAVTQPAPVLTTLCEKLRLLSCCLLHLSGRHLKGAECTGTPDSTGPGMGSRSISGTWEEVLNLWKQRLGNRLNLYLLSQHYVHVSKTSFDEY